MDLSGVPKHFFLKPAETKIRDPAGLEIVGCRDVIPLPPEEPTDGLYFADIKIWLPLAVLSHHRLEMRPPLPAIGLLFDLI